jgi:cobalt-zinc-cadmium efflux system protein
MAPHARDHAGHDHHGPQSYDRAFAIGIALNLAFVALEAIAGVAAGSLALLADAGHNLSDVLSLLLAWGAAWLGRRQPTPRRTYGYRRASILASLTNAVVLLVAVGAIAWEAVRRLGDPQPVSETIVLAVAALGIVINTATALLFMSGRKRDLNIEGAFLHMAADAAVSAGVVIAALVILATGWIWLDAAVSLAIALVIAVGTWRLLTASLDLALDAVPPGIDRPSVEAHLAGLAGVVEVHDLHIWAMSTTETALTAHLVCPAGADDAFLSGIQCDLQARFGIDHATLQIERGDPAHPCRLAAQAAG